MTESLAITKKLEKQMLEGSTAKIRKGSKTWDRIENYNVVYEFPVTWDWWQTIKNVNGSFFDIEKSKETNCAKAKYLHCVPSTKRMLKTGEILPVLRVRENFTIDPQNPQKQLTYSREYAELLLGSVKNYIQETSNEKIELLFDKNVHSLISMIIGYNAKRAIDDKRYESAVKKENDAYQRADAMKHDRKRMATELKLNFIKDVLAVLKKNNFKVPEDLLKEMACGQEFSSKVVMHVHKALTANVKQTHANIKKGDLTPKLYGYENMVDSGLSQDRIKSKKCKK